MGCMEPMLIINDQLLLLYTLVMAEMFQTLQPIRTCLIDVEVYQTGMEQLTNPKHMLVLVDIFQGNNGGTICVL